MFILERRSRFTSVHIPVIFHGRFVVWGSHSFELELVFWGMWNCSRRWGVLTARQQDFNQKSFGSPQIKAETSWSRLHIRFLGKLLLPTNWMVSMGSWTHICICLVPALGVAGLHLPPRNHLEKNHGAQLQPAGVGCGGMRHLHAAAQWELHCSPGVAWQHAARGWSLGTGPHFPDWGPCCAGEHGRDRWRTPEASFGPRWPPGRHRGCWHPGSLLLWLLLWCRQRSVRAEFFVWFSLKSLIIETLKMAHKAASKNSCDLLLFAVRVNCISVQTQGICCLSSTLH